MTNAREKLTYCAANVAAVLSALYIAFWLDLDRPYWAMFTVFIVSKPISGAVRAKGVYRFVGTLVGVSMSVFLVPPLVQSPVLLSLAASLWIGLCLFLALQDRTPRSYAFLLAGYSVAIVALSTVNAPTTIFDVAVTRLEEISIGIICASIAHAVFFPRNFAEVLQGQATEAIEYAAQVARKAVGPNLASPATAEVATIATAVANLDTLYSQIGLETSNVPRLPGVMIALLDRLAAALPQASLVCRSLETLRRRGPVSDRLRMTLHNVSAELSSLACGEMPALDSFRPSFAATWDVRNEKHLSESAALEILAARRAVALATALVEARQLAAALTEPSSKKSVERFVSDTPRPPFYRDRALAFLSAASATAGTLVACTLWIDTSWPEGFVAAQFAAICCSLFATIDTPSKPISEAVVGIIVALPVAAFYEFAILPGLDGFAALALVLTPVLLLFSYFQTFERLEGAAMILAVAFSGALALQESFASDFASFLNANLAEIIGPLIAMAMLLIFRTIDPVWNARRMLNSAWATIGELGRSRTSEPAAWVLPLFDRTGQAAMRLTGRAADPHEKDILFALRTLLNMTELRHSGKALGGATGERIEETLSQLGSVGPDRHERGVVLGRRLSTGLARLSTALYRMPPSAERLEGMIAVMALRLDVDPLFGGSEAMS
jgi:uncharacterized membrane protein YccC